MQQPIEISVVSPGKIRVRGERYGDISPTDARVLAFDLGSNPLAESLRRAANWSDAMPRRIRARPGWEVAGFEPQA